LGVDVKLIWIWRSSSVGLSPLLVEHHHHHHHPQCRTHMSPSSRNSWTTHTGRMYAQVSVNHFGPSETPCQTQNPKSDFVERNKIAYRKNMHLLLVWATISWHNQSDGTMMNDMRACTFIIKINIRRNATSIDCPENQMRITQETISAWQTWVTRECWKSHGKTSSSLMVH